ncbi:MAG: class I tRNA ligase family protein, partial [Anaerolineae bacterium]|nr:class I tRNA ligase family protein [Anaerolineae bacterium]
SKYPLYGSDETARQHTRRVLVYVLDTCMRLLHPYMPFVTEEIWSYLPHSDDKPLILAAWAKADESYIDDQSETSMDVLMEMVRGIRTVRMEYEVDPGKRITAAIAPGSHRANIEAYNYLFSRLCNVAEMHIIDGTAPEDSASVVVSDATVYLPLKGLIDFAAEIERMEKDQGKLQEQITKSESTLANENFVARARPDVVQKERERLAELQASAAQIASRLVELRAKV